jgi:deferrochelatase/peroxidase EfeB
MSDNADLNTGDVPSMNEVARLRAFEAAVLGHWRECQINGSTMKDLNWWLADAGYLEQVDNIVHIGDGKTITMAGGAWQLTAKHQQDADKWIAEQYPLEESA